MHAYGMLTEVVPVADILVQSGEKRWASHLTYNSAIREMGYENTSVIREVSHVNARIANQSNGGWFVGTSRNR